MNEPTLTDTERKNLLDAKDGLLDRDLIAQVERIVAEAVDRERAAWATKVANAWDEGVDYCEEIAGVGYNPVGTHDANPYRGLLAAGGTVQRTLSSAPECAAEALADMTAERDHWKAHAEEAGQGFAQVCRDYARVSGQLATMTDSLLSADDTETKPTACGCVCHGGRVGTACRQNRCESCAPEAKPMKRVHNHSPYRPVCNERLVDGQLRGACLNDDGTDFDESWRP